MRLTAPIAGVLATAALFAAPVAADAAANSGPILSGNSPCAAAGGFAKVQTGQSLRQVQQEMGSTGNTADTNTQGGFTREEITWRECSTVAGSTGVLTDGVTFNGSPTQPLTVTSKTQSAIGTPDGL